ncbi:hypothetical protein [Streptomyces sp. NPDC091219]|uniref:hypothetical protein n=1 Tax=Streptomyces sp. NPDC091219 TaxID=3155193 RepID=UPI003450B822
MTSAAGGAPSDACRAAVQGTLYGMVMCECFAAVSDEAAVGVLEAPGGPDPSVFDVLSLRGVGPVVVMARLEGILTDRTYDEARARPRSGQLSENPDSAVRSGS